MEEDFYSPSLMASLLSSGTQGFPTAQPVQAAAMPAEISASSPPPGTTWGVYSDPNDTTSQYTVNFSGGKKGSMPLTVSKDTPVFLYDNKTKQVLASGIGPEGANAVAAAVYKMNTDPNSKNEWWDIYTGPPGATDPSQFTSVVTDPRNTNFGQRFLSNLGTILPFAIQLIPGLGQASLLTKVAAGAAAGAGGAALKGQDILKGALIGGVTSGVLGANVLPGGQNLSGVLGKTLEGAPVVGDVLKDVSGAIKGGGSSFNPATGTITTTATKSLTPSLISGGLTSVVGSSALDLAQRYPGTTNYADQVYGKEPTLEQQFDDVFNAPTTVYGAPGADAIANAVTGGIAGTVPGAGTYYPDQNVIEVQNKNTSTNVGNIAPVVAQPPENVDPNTIEVRNKYTPQTFEDILAGVVGAVAPTLINSNITQPTQATDSKKSTLEDILKYYTLGSGLLDMLGVGQGGAASGTASPYASTLGAVPNFGRGTFQPFTGDYEQYAFGPEWNFFGNNAQTPATTANTLAATTPANTLLPALTATTATPTARTATTGVTAGLLNAPMQATKQQAAQYISNVTAGNTAKAPEVTVPGLTGAQQLYLNSLSGTSSPTASNIDYVRSLSDYQALASLANTQGVFQPLNSPLSGYKTASDLSALYGVPVTSM